MKISRIDHLNMTVNNLKESVKWYQDIFEFKVVEEGVSNDVPYSILRSGDTMLCIYEFSKRDYKNRFEFEDLNLHRINHVGFKIDQAFEEQFLQNVAQNKIQFLYGGLVQYLHSKSYYINDPTGYEIEVAIWNEDRVKFS